MNRPPRLLASTAAAVALVGLLGPAARAGLVAPGASQPAQAKTGPGSDGPCTVKQTQFDNAPMTYKDKGSDTQLGPTPVYVFQPAGAGTATVAGGRCDGAKRPTVFVAHGLGGTDPNSNYGGLGHHPGSVGNIVVYPTYSSNSGSLDELRALDRYVNAGMVTAAAKYPRIDTTRVGWWGHSLGGSMIPYLVQQGGLVRGWGRKAIWMNNVAQTFAELVTPNPNREAIDTPPNPQVLTVGFQDDELADNRLGDEVFHALTVPAAQKHHATVNSDAHGQPAFVADHFAPSGGNGTAIDAVDFAVWRYHDLLETCALTGTGCAADYSFVGTWSDGTDIVHATVVDGSQYPVDVGPSPAILAECDGYYGQQLNQDRIKWCPPTHLGAGF